jgi:hypothetical protein
MKIKMYILLMLVIFMCISFFLNNNYNYYTSTNNFVLQDNSGKEIETTFIYSDSILKMQIVDNMYYVRANFKPFLSIVNGDKIFINNGIPRSLCRKFYFFSTKNEKMKYLNEVYSNLDTIYLSGFRYYNLRIGENLDTFKIYKKSN